jgi:2'-hydroxyisoflavone reductase
MKPSVRWRRFGICPPAPLPSNAPIATIESSEAGHERKRTMKRRDLLIGSAALATGLCASRAIASRPRRILVLGGTNFVGPAIVERAIARGHLVTLFNRGRTNPHLFERLELLVGDRQPDSSAGLGALEGDRRWDAVVDVWPDNAALVGPTARMLRDRTDYYFFVSSVAVYASFDRPGLDETTPLKQSGTGYGARKAAAEALLGSLFEERIGFARPCAIVGPRDSSLSNYYWLSRLAAPGRRIGPGDGRDFMQLIDVRDVGRWVVDCIETRRAGAYNVCSRPALWREYLDQSRRAVHGRAEVTWIPESFLRENGIAVDEGADMPIWTSRNGRNGAFRQISARRAEALGLRTRPLVNTQADAWSSYRRIFPDPIRFPHEQYGHTWGIAEAREQEILAAWLARDHRESSAKATTNPPASAGSL